MYVRHPYGLWWTAIFIAFFGGLIAWGFHIQEADPSAQSAARIAIILTIIGSGFCIISATAAWWMRH